MSPSGENSANLLNAAASNDVCKTLGKEELQLGWDSEQNFSAFKENTLDIFYILMG